MIIVFNRAELEAEGIIALSIDEWDFSDIVNEIRSKIIAHLPEGTTMCILDEPGEEMLWSYDLENDELNAILYTVLNDISNGDYDNSSS